MKFADTVQLKSGGPLLRVEWEIGVTPTPTNHPLGNLDEILKRSTGYDDGDNSCVWSYRQKVVKKVFPVEALTLLPSSLIPATNQVLGMGNVVKVVDDKQLMTINWVIGKNCRRPQLIDLDQSFILKGWQIGDVSCVWFSRGILREEVFRASDLIKIYD